MESTDLSSSSDGKTNLPYKLLLACPAGLSRSQVFVDFSPSHDRKPHPNFKLEEFIDEVWKQRLLANPSLYNATKFRFGGYRILPLREGSSEVTSICLCLGLTDYRTFIGTNLSPTWEQFLVPIEDDVEQCQHTSSPLGNGAIVETVDNFVLVLQRSYNVGEFPGHLVFPGGHSEPEEVGISSHTCNKDKTFGQNLNSKISQEMFEGITREVVEEIGIPALSLSDPIFIGISRRVMNVRPTAFFYIKCSLPSLDIQNLYLKAKDGYESTQLCTVPKGDLVIAASKMPGCHQGGFALYDLMGKAAKDKSRGRVKPDQQSDTESKYNGNAACKSKLSGAFGHSDADPIASLEMTELDEDDCDQLADQVNGKLSIDNHDSVRQYESNGMHNKQNTNAEEVKPCGRINACMVVGKDTLYLYGGMMEIGDREVTLDDLYTLDLNKLDEWKCVVEASKTEWVEASDDEDDDDDENDKDEDEDSTESDSNKSDDDKSESEKKESSTGILGVDNAAAILRGEGKKLRRKERRAKIDQIRAELGLADSQRTPLAGESLKDFFSRTNLYWQMAAYEHTQHTGKELRKDGFDLAESRFKELKPVLDELAKLEAEQKAEEEEDAKNMLKKKGKEKAKHSVLHR